MFSCPNGQSPQLQHGGQTYNFNQPINVELKPTFPKCSFVEITYDCFVEPFAYDAEGNLYSGGISQAIGNLVYSGSPCSLDVIYETNEGGYKAFRVRLRSFCSEPPHEGFLIGGGYWADVLATVNITKIVNFANGQEYTNFWELIVTDSNGNQLLNKPTNDPNYTLTCVPNNSGSNCPPNTLDCGNGSCCDCDFIYNSISEIRHKIALLKIRDELPTGGI